MKKRFWPFVLLLGWMLAGCAGAETAGPGPEESEGESIAAETSLPESAAQAESSASAGTSETAPEEPSGETVSETVSEEPSGEASEEENSGTDGGLGMCQEHTFSYHSIPGRLIDFVGGDNFYNWIDSLPNDTHAPGYVVERFSIVDFVEQFNVSKEDFLETTRSWMTDEAMGRLGVTREEYQETYGYTDEQIDAIYSGDQSQINEAFCGDLAYYNPSDGQLYSIYWLSDHTAADYQAAGVPVSEVERILDDASAMGGSYASLAEAAAPAAEAYALE